MPSNAPVCSVARSTLATGILAPRAGLQYHRKTATGKLPKGLKPWSAILRDNGYFCTNIKKTDYNFSTDAKLWDKAPRNQKPWASRPDKAKPFFTCSLSEVLTKVHFISLKSDAETGNHCTSK